MGIKLPLFIWALISHIQNRFWPLSSLELWEKLRSPRSLGRTPEAGFSRAEYRLNPNIGKFIPITYVNIEDVEHRFFFFNMSVVKLKEKTMFTICFRKTKADMVHVCPFRNPMWLSRQLKGGLLFKYRPFSANRSRHSADQFLLFRLAKCGTKVFFNRRTGVLLQCSRPDSFFDLRYSRLGEPGV